jgi:hypothetical protein
MTFVEVAILYVWQEKPIPEYLFNQLHENDKKIIRENFQELIPENQGSRQERLTFINRMRFN